MLFVSDMLATVSPPQLGPPSVNGPLVADTDTDPVTVVPQIVIASAPDELKEPVIEPPLRYRAPPVATLTDPVTLPPVDTQMACPLATVSDPLCVVVMQACEKPTEMVVVVTTEV
jgi:hypothetical protein